jgi:hypothetical protein
MSMMIINVFMLLLGETIVLLNGNMEQIRVKLLRGEMVKEVEVIS